MGAEATTFERIALARLPELQTADGLFLPAPATEARAGMGGPSPVGSSSVVLIGLARADEAGLDHGFHLGSIRAGILSGIGGEEVSAGDLGLALWAESLVDGGAVGEIRSAIERRAGGRLARLPLDQLGWLVSGLVSAAGLETEASIESDAVEAVAELSERIGEKGLFLDAHHRFGGGLSPVGSQFHALIALHSAGMSGLGEVPDADRYGVAETLASLQRGDGAWPGVVDTRRGIPAEVYPVLTVDQIALSQMALGPVSGNEVALEMAIAWAEGQNALGFRLVHPREERIDHGIFPRKSAGSVARGVERATRILGAKSREHAREDLILDPNASSADVGWLLEAWAGGPRWGLR